MVNIQIEHMFLSIYVVLSQTRTYTILRELQDLISNLDLVVESGTPRHGWTLRGCCFIWRAGA